MTMIKKQVSFNLEVPEDKEPNKALEYIETFMLKGLADAMEAAEQGTEHIGTATVSSFWFDDGTVERSG